MKEILTEKLREYIRLNNPDLLILLQEQGNLAGYLSEKVALVNDLCQELTGEQKPYIIEEMCMEAMTADLKPSKYLYIERVLQEEFEAVYLKLLQSGTLTYEVINIIEACKPVFEAFGFNEASEEDRSLRYAITGSIMQYIEK